MAVEISVIAHSSNGDTWHDAETIQIERSLESGRLIRESDYTYAQEMILGYTPHFLLEEELSGVNST